QLEEHGARPAGPERSLLRDEVDVLENDDRGSQPAGETSECADEAEARAGQDDHRRVGEASREKADGVRLPGPRRAPEEQASGQVPAVREQCLTVPGRADDVALDAREDTLGQDELRLVHVRSLEKLQAAPASAVGLD